MSQNEIQQAKRTSVFSSNLGKYCHHSIKDGAVNESHFIEITEWSNGEGYDVCIETNGSEKFSFTYGQWKLLKKMMKKISNLPEEELFKK